MTPLLLVHVFMLSRVWLFATPGLQSTRLLCQWNFPGQNTGMDCHFPLQGMFLPQRWNPCLLCLLHWQVDSLPLSHLGNHHYYYHHIIISQPFHPKSLGTWPHHPALLSLRPKVEGLGRVEWLPCLKSNPREGTQALHTWPRAVDGEDVHRKGTGKGGQMSSWTLLGCISLYSESKFHPQTVTRVVHSTWGPWRESRYEEMPSSWSLKIPQFKCHSQEGFFPSFSEQLFFFSHRFF